NELGAVAAGRHIIRTFVFGPGAAHDVRAIGAVRLPVEHIGGKVELGREQVVNGAIGGQLEQIVHLPPAPEEKGVADGVVLDGAPIVIIEQIQLAFASADRAGTTQLY